VVNCPNIVKLQNRRQNHDDNKNDCCTNYFIFILESIFLTIFSLINYFSIKRCKIELTSNEKLYYNYVVLLPVLREQNIIAETMKYFSDIILKSNQKITIIIISTIREKEEYEYIKSEYLNKIKNNVNLRDEFDELSKIVDSEHLEKTIFEKTVLSKDEIIELIAKYPKQTTMNIASEQAYILNGIHRHNVFECVESTSLEKGKVGQMNYVINNCNELLMNCDYIGIYDADSRPDKSVFDSMSSIIKKRTERIVSSPTIFQQVSVYCNNVNELYKNRKYVSIVDAFAQTRWAIGFEYTLYKYYSKAVLKNKLRPLVYCIGHGCFIKYDKLIEMQGFPKQSPNDDLALGYLASAKGEEVYPLAVIDYCDAAPGVINSIKQSRFWFLGSKRFWKDIKFYKTDYKIRNSRIQLLVFFLQGHIRNFIWAMRSILFFFGAIISIYVDSKLFVYLLLSVLIYTIGGHIITYPIVNGIGGKKLISKRGLFISSIYSLFGFMIRSIGPFLGLILGSEHKEGITQKVER